MAAANMETEKVFPNLRTIVFVSNKKSVLFLLSSLLLNLLVVKMITSVNSILSEIPTEIPTDTNGHALPPPCLPEEVCSYKRYEWRGFWNRFIACGGVNPLPQCSCCVCGKWFGMYALTQIERENVNKEIQKRNFNTTLDEVYVCKRCKWNCACKRPVPQLQMRKFKGCEPCKQKEEETKKKRKKSSDPPSGR
jgi:hypothetical protein